LNRADIEALHPFHWGFEFDEILNQHGGFDAIITNPPWERALLHPMILRFQEIAPTWLLFEADWAFTRQANAFMDHCSHIVAVGRLRWVPGTKHSAMDSCAWYRFHAQHVGGPKLIPAQPEKARHVEEEAA